LDLSQHTGPAARVVLAGDGQFGETAMRNTHQRSALAGCEFPAHDRALRGLLVPVGDPRICENTRRIVLEYFAVAVELAGAVDVEFRFFGVVGPATALARIESE